MSEKRNYRSQHDRVAAYLAEKTAIAELLEYEGPAVIARLCGPGKKYSMRGLAVESGLSVSYLSKVLNGIAKISPYSFCRLCQIEMGMPEHRIVEVTK